MAAAIAVKQVPLFLVLVVVMQQLSCGPTLLVDFNEQDSASVLGRSPTLVLCITFAIIT